MKKLLRWLPVSLLILLAALLLRDVASLLPFSRVDGPSAELLPGLGELQVARDKLAADVPAWKATVEQAPNVVIRHRFEQLPVDVKDISTNQRVLLEDLERRAEFEELAEQFTAAVRAADGRIAAPQLNGLKTLLARLEASQPRLGNFVERMTGYTRVRVRLEEECLKIGEEKNRATTAEAFAKCKAALADLLTTQLTKSPLTALRDEVLKNKREAEAQELWCLFQEAWEQQKKNENNKKGSATASEAATGPKIPSALPEETVAAGQRPIRELLLLLDRFLTFVSTEKVKAPQCSGNPSWAEQVKGGLEANLLWIELTEGKPADPATQIQLFHKFVVQRSSLDASDPRLIEALKRADKLMGDLFRSKELARKDPPNEKRVVLQRNLLEYVGAVKEELNDRIVMAVDGHDQTFLLDSLAGLPAFTAEHDRVVAFDDARDKADQQLATWDPAVLEEFARVCHKQGFAAEAAYLETLAGVARDCPKFRDLAAAKGPASKAVVQDKT